MAAKSYNMSAWKSEVDVQEILRKMHLSGVERVSVILAKEDQGSLPEVK